MNQPHFPWRSSRGRRHIPWEKISSRDFGINLIDTPDNPTTTLTITGDLAPIDSDPNTPGAQVQYDGKTVEDRRDVLKYIN